MGRKLLQPGKRNRRRSAHLWRRSIQRQSWVESLEPRVVLAADPILSEFQAINVSTIKDVDGHYEDWIEIRNPGTEELSLSGWHLTDEKEDRDKWTFPDVRLAAGEYLVVFASNKDRTDPQNELHTNFRLDGDGEYLALIKPDGTPTREFDPYPAQFADQSYGLATGRDTTELIADDASIKALVPNDDSLGTTWTATDFNDAGWEAGTTAAGYEVLLSGVTQRDDFDTLSLGPEWTVDIPDGGTGTVNLADGAVNFSVPAGQDTTAADRGLAPIVYRDVLVGGDFPEDYVPPDYEIITQVTRDLNSNGGVGLMVYSGSTSSPVVQLEYSGGLYFRMYALDERVGSKVSIGRDSFYLRLVRDGIADSWTGYYKLNEGDDWIEVGSVPDEDGEGPVIPVITSPKAAMYARTPTGTMDASFEFMEIIIPDQQPVYGPEINLDVEQSMRLSNSSIYLRMPFTVEGDPARFDEMGLTVRYDDGFVAYLNDIQITAQNVPVDFTWNSAASGVYGAVGGSIPIQQIDVGEHIGALNSGDNVLAIHGMNHLLETDPLRNDFDFFFDATLVANQILSLTEQFFITPTPGETNEAPAAPAPQIVGGDGTFFGSTTFELVLENPAPTLEIRYTLDGSDPTVNSTLYTGAITLTESARLQAKTYDTSAQGSFVPGNITSGTFIALDPGLRDVSSDLPLMVLDTLGQSLPGTSSTSLVGMNVILLDVSKATGRSTLDDGIVEYLGRGGARDRGSSTSGQPKPNMTFETWGPTGTGMDDDADFPLLGLPADSDWILHAPYNYDRTLIRNQMAFDLSNEMDMWATHWRHVEVYLNRGRDGVVSEADYAGVYVLMERVQQGDNRIDIADGTIPLDNTDPNPPEMSGGYIWKIDRSDPDAPAFTAGSQSMNWVYPKSPRSRTARDEQKATNEQQEWVQNYFNEFRDTLRDADINDPEGYSKYINPISWVDHHMLNVFIMNVDALRLSAYFYKDQDGRVDYGPVFDFDRSAESTDDRDDDPYVWRSERGDRGTDFFGNGTQRWWGDLFDDPGFWQLYVDRWQMWRRTTLSDENVGEVIDEIAGELRESQGRNFTKWRSVAPRANSGFNSGILDRTWGGSEMGVGDEAWGGEVGNMIQWLKERAAFMDSNFVQPVIFQVDDATLPDVPGVYVDPGQEVVISGPLLEFNVDTQLISGTPGETTSSYLVPTDDSLGTSWAQPGFNDASWSSGPTGLGFDDASTTVDFAPVLRTEVRPTDVQAGATTILSRFSFQVSDLQEAQANDLVLRMKYDDGFVTYLNGTEILRHNLRDDELAWNSRARSRSSPRDSEMAENFQDFDISAYKNLLVQGNNVLAIRGINSSATSTDMLVLPELVSREVLYGVNPAAKVYYTTDSTDPRGPDGNPSPTAELLPAGQTITIDQNTRVIARNFDNQTDRGEEATRVGVNQIYWSGPLQYDFVTTTSSLVVNEINYNPYAPTDAEVAAADLDEGVTLDRDDFEFIEIHNSGNTVADLVGVALTDGVDFDFYGSAITTLEPGGYAVVVSNMDAFQLRYGSDLPVAGQYTGNLNNGGEDVDLVDGTGTVIFTVMYGDSDPWPVRADGSGATLELVNPRSTPLEVQSKWYSWRGSREYGGTPGSAGAGPVGVVINEVLAATRGVPGLQDSIELLNTSSEPIDISGWYLSDSDDDFLKFQIPANTVLQPGQYVVYDERQFNPGGDVPGFGLSQDFGDDVWLAIPDGPAAVSGFADDVHFGATLSAESLGRMPNGSGRLAPLSSLTFGFDNGTPRVGPLVVSEIHYNPVLTDEDLEIYPDAHESDLEYVELHNPTGQEYDLTNWRLRAGADFDFPAGTKLATGETIVILKFDPADPENINELNMFKAHYGIGEDVRLLGGYQGRLNNSDDRLVLQHPMDPPADEPNYIPRFQEDEVLYDDKAPWPLGADGNGYSLQRRGAGEFGNDPASWFSGTPSPGVILTQVTGDFNDDGLVNAVDIDLLFVQIRSDDPDLSYDLTNDGKVDNDDRDELVEGILGTITGDANLDSIFNSADMVQVFQRGEYEDGIPLNSGWAEGDWTGDGEFTSSDMVLAFQKGGYVAAAVPRVQARIQAGLIGAALAPDRGVREQAVASAARAVQARPVNPTPEAPRVALVDEAIETLFQDEPDSVGDDDGSVEQLSEALLEDLA